MDKAEPLEAQPASERPRTHHSLRALGSARGHLQKKALKLLGYAIVAYLIVRLIPGLKQALRSLEQVRWQWVLAAFGVETLSELGFVVSWRAIVDPEDLLSREGRGERMASRVAWVQLGGGMLVPGGTLSSVGVGAWILHRFGMPNKLIAERQFNLQFLNTGIDALALIVSGARLASGIVPCEAKLTLPVLAAAVSAIGIAGALLIARIGTGYAERAHDTHPKTAAAIEALADAVEDTKRLLTHRGGLKAVLGA